MRTKQMFVLLLTVLIAACGNESSIDLGSNENCVQMATPTSPSQRICFENVNGRAVVEGDIDIGAVADLKAPESSRGAVAVAKGSLLRWPNKTIPYVIDPAMPNSARVTDAIAYYHQNTAIRFVARTSEASYLQFSRVPAGGGCFSPLGRQSGTNTIYLEDLCSLGNVKHEIGHSLGLYHEQSREDRDLYVKINLDNILEDKKSQFERKIFFAQDIGSYDIDSIMHYSPMAFAKDTRPTITKLDGTYQDANGNYLFGQRSYLSAKDKAALETLYSSSFVETPDSLVISGISQTGATLAFNDNSDPEGGFRIEKAGPYVGTPPSILSFAAWTNLPASAGVGTKFISLTGLQSGALYYFRVVALNSNSTLVSSAPSVMVPVQTLADLTPTAPSNLVISFVSSNQMNISWKDNSSNEDGFKIERATGSGSFTQIFQTTSQVQSYSDAGLAGNTSYTYRVRAFKGSLHSGFSLTASATTQSSVTLPNAPSGLTVTATSTSITLNWTKNSSNESGFKIERLHESPGQYYPLNQVGAGVTSYVDNNVASGVSYTYVVRAYNSAGSSSSSNAASTMLQGTPPATPSNLVANAVSSTQVNLTWTSNSSNHQGFTIRRKLGINGTYGLLKTVAPGARSFSDMTVTAGNSYYYRIYAYNAYGSSAYSAEAVVVTPGGSSLAAPTGLAASQHIVDPSVVLIWNNANSGTVMNIERKLGATGVFSQIGTSTSNYFLDGTVSPGNAYVYRVRASNSTGASPYSNETSISLSATPPAAPGNLSFVLASGNYANLRWADNSTNEASFLVEVKHGTTGTFGLIAIKDPGVSSHTYGALLSGKTYFFRVKAHNLAGDSSYSNEVSVVVP